MYTPLIFDLAMDHRRELMADADNERRLSEARIHVRQRAAHPSRPARVAGVQHVWQRLFAAGRGEPITN